MNNYDFMYAYSGGVMVGSGLALMNFQTYIYQLLSIVSLAIMIVILYVKYRYD